MPFNGRATYDDFPMIGEDISDILLLISPTETPFLNRLPTAPRAAISVEHDWREIALGPDHIIASTAVNSATADTGVQINGFGANLQVGMLLELEVTSGVQEVVQINCIPGPNSILVQRNKNGTGINSLAPGAQLFVIATASFEGEDTDGDVSRPRTNVLNYTQIFKKPVKVSGSARSVQYLPDTGDEFDFQTTLRAIELARDLEKAVLRGVKSSSIGTATTYRTMGGLRSFLTSINSTVSANSFSADPLLWINDAMQNCWNAGARDLDVIIAGDQWKRDISNTNASKLYIQQDERGVMREITRISTDFGSVEAVLTPWLPSRHAMVVSTRRIIPVPLRGRSFHREALAKTGDSDRMQVLGEYTLEIHHQEAMAQLHT